MIEKMKDNFGCVIWCGGLNGRYNDDAKKMFPKRKYMHNLPECSIDAEDIIFCLYRNLNTNFSPSEFCLRCMELSFEEGKKEGKRK